VGGRINEMTMVKWKERMRERTMITGKKEKQDDYD
jgi:hypothetical protein